MKEVRGQLEHNILPADHAESVKKRLQEHKNKSKDLINKLKESTSDLLGEEDSLLNNSTLTVAQFQRGISLRENTYLNRTSILLEQSVDQEFFE